MSSLEEFRQEVIDIRSKIDSDRNSAQKNRVLLQSIKDMCARTLQEPKISAQYESEIKKTLMEAERELGQLASQGSAIPIRSSPGEYLHPQPTKQELESVAAGGFDPNSSPILRKLMGQKSNTLKETPSPSIPKQTRDKKKKPKPSAISATPFPKATKPKKKTAPKKTEAIFLEIPQIDIKFKLIFTDGLIELNKDIFKKQKYSHHLPDEFFSTVEETNHCAIKKIDKGKYLLMDPLNQQKTYFKNNFVSVSGIEIKSGEEFILPVMINGQMSSLSVVFSTN